MPLSDLDIPLESKLAFLRQASSYPQAAYRVEMIETHMSWVFLTERFAYKLKKPIRYGLIDFSTIDARRFYCEEEVRLNRRLAASVYLEAVPLVIDVGGHLQLQGDGMAVDWLVKMRRLPDRHMFDYVIKNGTATEQDARHIAALLSRFYRSLPPVVIDPSAYRDRFQSDIEDNHRELCAPLYQLPLDQVQAITRAQRTALQRLSPLLDERIRAGKVIEGHGDLRPEHVCLRPELVIIDCLEFSRTLRIIDAADEVAFLALECERLGVPRIAAALLRAYAELSSDAPPAALLHFYQSQRACVRAKLAIWHMNEEKFRYSGEWPRRARQYLVLAQQHQVLCA
ncbi:MAG TPA: hypothetical protein VHK70_01370 [Burkholderiaceae bacterium]|nr:hypothetical protein [Burkholderiaceae bacterium]